MQFYMNNDKIKSIMFKVPQFTVHGFRELEKISHCTLKIRSPL